MSRFLRRHQKEAVPFLYAALLVLFSLPSYASDIVGKARVIDGDTLEIGKTKIRLHGIDAPEGKQLCTLDAKPWDCGQEAKRVLVDLVADREVRCQVRDIDRYKRVVGVCSIGEDPDINEFMVRSGWALAYRQYSKDYVSAEADAQRKKVGVWRGKFEKPWDWRRKSR